MSQMSYLIENQTILILISGDSGDDADGSATTNESKSEVL